MKSQIVSALASLLVLAGCETKKEDTSSQQEKPQTVVQKVVQKPLEVRAQPTPIQPVETVIVEREELALEHDQPKTDHMDRARSLSEIGDFKGALTEARRALYSNGENEDALKLITKMAVRMGKPAMAAEAQLQLGELNPIDAVPFISRTRFLISAGEFSSAVTSAEEALKRDIENVDAWHMLGRAHFSDGSLTLAIDAFERAIELNPDHGYALNNLGLAYLRANENKAALQVLERASAQLPNVAYVQNNLGVALERAGLISDAKEAFDRATLLSPKYVKARVNQNRVAKAEMDSSVEFEPTFIEVPGSDDIAE